MSLFHRKKDSEKQKEAEQHISKVIEQDKKRTVQPEGTHDFVYGVEDVFALKDSDNVVVVGKVRGTVTVGDAVYICNPGSDHDEILLTTVLGIEIGPGEKAQTATDCHAALCIEKGGKYPLRKASVLFTRNRSSRDVHDAYINVLGDVFVMRQKCEFTDEELEKLSITDCSEIWRLFAWFHSKVKKDETEEEDKINRNKIDRLAKSICNKLMKIDVIYCVYNKSTGEPHMLSSTVKRENDYMCTPPDIRIYTKAYAEVMKDVFPKDKYEIREIENGEKGDGIYNFLGSTFYLNGACGIQIVNEQTSIDASMLVPKPDYSNIPKQNVPVTNPDLVRWMLLLGQMGKPEGEDAELIEKLYYRFMAIEMTKANLLIPMQQDGDFGTPDENGNTVLKKDLEIKFPTMGGKYDRDAVRMFTDWKRLRMVYDEKWSGMVQTIDGMIDVFDCAINATQYPDAGCYISKEMYENMKQQAGGSKQ